MLLLALLACHKETLPTTISCDVAQACDTAVTVTADMERELPASIPIEFGTSAIVVGDLAGTGAAQIYVSQSATITRLDGEGWTTATEVWAGGTKAYPVLADLTGDGLLDLAIDIPDGDVPQVLVFPGPVTGSVDRATPHFELAGSGGRWADWYPHQMYISAGDLNADGFDDLVVGPWVKFGPITADATFDPSVDALWEETAGTHIYTQAATEDLTGDGIADLVFNAGILTANQCYRPSFAWADLRIAAGPILPGTQSIQDAPIRLAVDGIGGVAILPWLADVNGDSDVDLLTAGFDLTFGSGLSGLAEAQLFLGPITDGEAPTTRFAIPFAVPDALADVDGDDIPDLLLAGGAVIFGPFGDRSRWDAQSCEVQVDEAWTTGSDAWTLELYTDASWVGDLDGDSIVDIILAQGQELRVVLGAG